MIPRKNMKPHSEEVIIEPDKTLTHAGRELWQYRELIFFLAWRNLLIRYKQKTIGILWAVLRPLLTMIIFTIIFSKLAKMPSFSIPFPLLVYAGLLPWQFFSSTVSEGSTSILNDSSLVSKVYFPRLIVPTSSILTGLVDLIISLILFMILMIPFKFMPTLLFLTLPFFFILLAMLSLGISYFFSALNIRYRDFCYILPFLIQVGMYISPVGFSSRSISEQWQILYSLNPVVGIIEGFRWALLGGRYPLNISSLCISFFLTVAIFILGIRFFLKNERQFADIL